MKKILTSLSAVVMLTLGLIVGVPNQAVADDFYDAFAAWSGTSYVYVRAGETMSLQSGQVGASYTIKRPDGTTAAACTVTAAVPCTFSEVAASEGVWTVARNGGPVYTTAIESIGPKDAAGTLVKGRMWAELLTVNTGNQYGSASSHFYVLSNYGVQYEITLPLYQPWGANLSADNLGVVYKSTCQPTYFSVPIPGTYQIKPGIDPTNYTLADRACPNYVPYRLFAEIPDPTMPATVPQWADGRTSQTWVYSSYRTPAVTGTFTRTALSGDAGTFSGTLSGQPGALQVVIDVNGNGSFTDPVDVTLPKVAAGLGSFSIPWDGLDGLGNPVPTSLVVPYEIRYSGEAEIHYVMWDSEGRTGGISMTRLNGPGGPDSRINWDDETALSKRTSDNVIPNPLVGVMVDSSTPVHSWSRGIPSNLAYGWGDGRMIDDWAAVQSTAKAVGKISALGSIGDRVWLDANVNGVQDAAEAGLPGIQVQLLDSAGTVLAQTTTDASGNYAFANLAAGSYRVRVQAPGYFVTVRDVGQDATDSDADPTGATGLITLAEGQVNTTVDIGLYRSGAIGDRVWEDLNGNGIQDPGEPGLAGVTVSLRDSAGTVVATTTTTATGSYGFSVRPGLYSVSFAAPNGYQSSPANIGADDAADSDAAASGATGQYLLGSGAMVSSVDAGFFRPVSIGDLVWIDTNGNGSQDADEAGLPGVTLTLTSSAGVVMGEVTTGAGGSYQFAGLPPGGYVVTMTTPAGYTAATTVLSTGALVSGTALTSIDFAVTPPPPLPTPTPTATPTPTPAPVVPLPQTGSPVSPPGLLASGVALSLGIALVVRGTRRRA